MGRFALGKHALGISDRSGVAYRLKDMRKEWTGMLVGKDEWEQKHPQLETRKKVIDPQALKDARPDRIEPLVVYVGIPTIEQPNPGRTYAVGGLGFIEVVTS